MGLSFRSFCLAWMVNMLCRGMITAVYGCGVQRQEPKLLECSMAMASLLSFLVRTENTLPQPVMISRLVCGRCLPVRKLPGRSTIGIYRPLPLVLMANLSFLEVWIRQFACGNLKRETNLHGVCI